MAKLQASIEKLKIDGGEESEEDKVTDNWRPSVHPADTNSHNDMTLTRTHCHKTLENFPVQFSVRSSAQRTWPDILS